MKRQQKATKWNNNIFSNQFMCTNEAGGLSHFGIFGVCLSRQNADNHFFRHSELGLPKWIFVVVVKRSLVVFLTRFLCMFRAWRRTVWQIPMSWIEIATPPKNWFLIVYRCVCAFQHTRIHSKYVWTYRNEWFYFFFFHLVDL